jgi:hypothetical protein
MKVLPMILRKLLALASLAVTVAVFAGCVGGRHH